MTPKRERFETKFMRLIGTIDPSGYNTDYYKRFFGRMPDSLFDEWVRMVNRGQTRFYVYVENLKTALQVPDILKAADLMDFEFFEHIKMWDPIGRRYYETPYKYLILKLPVRRLKQYLMDKISIPESDRTINPLSGQVTRPDKGAAISLVEAQTLDSKGLHKCFTELMTVRGGNIDAYAAYKSSLEETGSVDIKSLNMGSGVRSTMVAHIFLNAMHLENNL